MDKQNYLLPASLTEAVLWPEIETKYSLKEVVAEPECRQYLDTFDWRLYKKGWSLINDGRGLTLEGLKRDKVVYQVDGGSAPAFAWDLPEGDLKAKIAPLLEMRRLLPQATLHMVLRRQRVLNADEKTVVRLSLQTVSIAPAGETGPYATYLLVEPVRGYVKETARVVRIIKACGATAVGLTQGYDQALAAAGKYPGRYVAKPSLPLAPDMPSEKAMRMILSAELKVMRINEPYIGLDLDSEFLHDYRVALRRSRSALSLMKGVFPDAETSQFKRSLKQVNIMTNQLRDLDVYLLAEKQYRALIPDLLQADIVPLFAYLHEKRAAVLQTTVTALESAEYRQIMLDYEQFLAGQNAEQTRNGGLPILGLAGERIRKRHQRILQDGRRILISKEDEAMHELRIECKKLRYMMEFFSALYPQKEIAKSIGQLKVLQTNLGDFNDYCVQEEYLLAIADELSGRQGLSQRALLAIGALVARLHEERLRVKADFAMTFTAFAAPENSKQFSKLFKTKKRSRT